MMKLAAGISLALGYVVWRELRRPLPMFLPGVVPPGHDSVDHEGRRRHGG
jgi:hypothetical protein